MNQSKNVQNLIKIPPVISRIFRGRITLVNLPTVSVRGLFGAGTIWCRTIWCRTVWGGAFCEVTFPAEAVGGLRYLENVASPYRHLGVRYIPLGGVGPDNLVSYISSPDVLAVGGSWLAPRDLMEKEDWGAIEQLAREAVDLVKGATE